MCLSNVSARFASSSRWKAEFSMNIPQNCHFTRWVPAIIFWTRSIMEMVFDFHFHRERRLRKKQYTVVLSHSLYPLHSLAHPLPFFLCLSPSSFFFSFLSSPVPHSPFSFSATLTRCFLQGFQMPGTGRDTESSFRIITRAWEPVFLHLPVGDGSSKAKWWWSDFQTYFASWWNTGLDIVIRV